jgi:hypothetical protein
VICVGGVNNNTTNAWNYGSGVDIWAPYDVFSTVTPASMAADDNDWGQDELYHFGGTSAATPFVAGVVAMMKALNPNLTYDGVQDLLQLTARDSTDAKVAKGYVDALAAVEAVRENQLPTIHIETPLPDSTHSYHNLQFRATITDPDPGAGLSRFNNETLVGFYGDGTQLLCLTNIITYNPAPGYNCTATNVPIGIKSVEAKVTDPFGGVGTTEQAITIQNTAPIVQLISPVDGATFYETQFIKFSAYVFDPDEDPYPSNEILWHSDISGDLSNGPLFHLNLPQGTHHMTVTATDEKGASTQVSFTLHILSGAGIPSVFITQPGDGTFYGYSQPVHFEGYGYDTEDGNLTGNSLEWRSNIDGLLGYGTSIDVVLTGASNCQQAVQDHTITLKATDSDGHSVTDQILVEVGIIC